MTEQKQFDPEDLEKTMPYVPLPETATPEEVTGEIISVLEKAQEMHVRETKIIDKYLSGKIIKYGDMECDYVGVVGFRERGGVGIKVRDHATGMALIIPPDCLSAFRVLS